MNDELPICFSVLRLWVYSFLSVFYHVTAATGCYWLVVLQAPKSASQTEIIVSFLFYVGVASVFYAYVMYQIVTNVDRKRTEMKIETVESSHSDVS